MISLPLHYAVSCGNWISALAVSGRQCTEYRYANGKVEKRILSDLSESREVIDHEFHLPKLPVEDAVKVLQELGFNIFKGAP